ncbi:hypothetical protein D2V17_13060 [Aurantiacibacter xanthus]|uniref:Uncharacterized protein n=1 Tax=Aurantiacibacter xanthus TaxID=1784712 RepID=A0A3A1P400_9SPHN|nr:hypothetical protein [Aurantiacibacter xanthus]RIV83515.1 hypothetical protein D2V17_13060 [Aurantiacibacter xanthus]
MSTRAEQSDLEIQAVLRAEIRDLQFRHEVEIALLHATYALILNGPAEGLPTLAEQTRLTLDSVLFDTDWYLETYSDVAQSGMVPAEHYVRAGAFEGRDPGPKFATMAYYFANPDVAEAGWPALVHYVHSGKTEGRPLA